MSQGNKHRGRQGKLPSGEPQAMVNMTVDRFARRVVNWLVEWADENDIQKFVAEFEGVPIRDVSVADDEIRIVGGH